MHELILLISVTNVIGFSIISNIFCYKNNRLVASGFFGTSTFLHKKQSHDSNSGTNCKKMVRAEEV